MTLHWLKSLLMPQNPVAVSVADPLPVNPYASGLSLVSDITLAITRPSNTTAYNAGDVIGIADAGTPANAGSAIHALAAAGEAGALMLLAKLELTIGLSAVPSGMANFRLHMFNATPTAILDNAALTFVAGDQAKHLGWVDLPTPEVVGSLLKTTVSPFLPFKLAAGQTDFKFLLETRGGYTPASGTIYTGRAVFARLA